MNKAIEFIEIFITALVSNNKNPLRLEYKTVCKKSLEEQIRLLKGYTFKLEDFDSYYHEINAVLRET